MKPKSACQVHPEHSWFASACLLNVLLYIQNTSADVASCASAITTLVFSTHKDRYV